MYIAFSQLNIYMYTLNYSRAQLDRVYDYIDLGQNIRIIHILTDESSGFASHWEDRYIVLLDCDPRTYTLLLLL